MLPPRFADGWVLRRGGPPYRYEHEHSTLDVEIHPRANRAVAFEDVQKFRPIYGVTAFQYDRWFIICRGTGIEQNSFLELVRNLRDEWLRGSE